MPVLAPRSRAAPARCAIPAHGRPPDGLEPAPDQNVALRLVVLADRLYDRQVPLTAAGLPLNRLFGEEMLAGGYRKKYRRAISRLVALARLSSVSAV